MLRIDAIAIICCTPARLSPAEAWGLALRIDPDAVVIEVDRVYKLAKGDIAQVAINLYRDDLFRHTITLRRGRS
jgi:DNA-binding GntR family transcriptional regulator